MTAGLLGGGVADAKKKGKRKAANTFTVTRTVPVSIPLRNAPTGQNGFAKVAIGTVGGKQLKGKVIGLDGVTVTSTFTGGAGFAQFITATVIAPSGQNANLINPTQNSSVPPPSEIISGPTIETPNSATSVCIPANTPGFVQPPCSNPDATLGPPYAGTIGNLNLLRFVGLPVRGEWVVKLRNGSNTIPASLSSITVTGRVISAFPSS